MNELNNLEYEAGIGGGMDNERIKKLRLDNGDDKYGTNATGEFIVKTGKKDSFIREQHGKNLEVIVLLQRARISMSSMRGGVMTSEWFSDEFNSLNKNELIKIRKSGTKNFKEMTYEQVQQAYPKVQGQMGMKNPFSYETILYIRNMLDDEIYKLSLSGAQMRNWIEFRQSHDFNLWERTVVLEARPKSDDPRKFEISFCEGSEIDYNKTKMQVIDLLTMLPKNKTLQLEQSQVPRLSQESSNSDIDRANRELQILSEEERNNSN